MIYETLAYAVDHNVAVITLNRPRVMNALNSQMRAEITDAMGQAGQAARVVVLTGSGRAFCSGQDLGAEGNFADIDLERELEETIDTTGSLTNTMHELESTGVEDEAPAIADQTIQDKVVDTPVSNSDAPKSVTSG